MFLHMALSLEQAWPRAERRQKDAALLPPP